MSPRIGHLDQAIRCVAYLKNYTRSKIIFDDTQPSFGDSSFFKHSNWSEYYLDAKEPIPLSEMSTPVDISTYILGLKILTLNSELDNYTNIFEFSMKNYIGLTHQRIH